MDEEKIEDTNTQSPETTEKKYQTYGEYAVGIGFNPSGNEAVDFIKRAAADMIDNMVLIRDNTKIQEQRRLAALAITAFEEGAMWAVKSVTKQEWDALKDVY